MKYRINIAFLIVFSVLFVINGSAQNNKEFKPWEFKINAGYNIGGSSPLPLPEEIRKIIGYTPNFFAPHIAYEASYRFTPKWGIAAQASFDVKSFEVRDRVQHLYTKMDIGEGSQTGEFEGLFTGKNKTKINNSYFSVPLMISYHPSEKWVVQGGVFISYLYSGKFEGNASDGYLRNVDPTGEKIEVEIAEFDFSDDLRKYDWGALLSGEWKFSKSFALKGQVAWSFIPIFPSNFTNVPFKMYNIYGTVGISYLLTSF
jgi:hypothetical protein